ncbi:MAG TPA: multiheme c-type cytochrome [Rhizomicrobium sp.]|nr:multiheme c-type cytochrome [Rhizomicrobium sp.]
MTGFRLGPCARACGLFAILLLLFAAVAHAADAPGTHEGVASCGGSTCHGRLAPTGKDVRQNELITWQDMTSAAGAHSQAWQVLNRTRAQNIANRLGLGPAQNAQDCLGCHGEPAALRGKRFQISDGVGCEACHGGSGAWLVSHYAVDATHADNVKAGMTALEDPRTRAGVCLDCHFGSNRPGQFVTHRMMAAGHPRISFELDLFSALQRHYDFDADYVKRKPLASGIKFWAVGQAMAVDRALSLYAEGSHVKEGAFPEFYFFDCQSCHRRIFDDPGVPLAAEANPARPVPPGTPPFDDENMIMLSAIARVAAPSEGVRFDAAARAFHIAMAQNGGDGKTAATQLAEAARALAGSLAAHAFNRAETFAALDAVLNGAAARYTDYEGGAQAVMAADTLLNSLVALGQIPRAGAESVRPDINKLYAEVRDTNNWHPAEFRDAIRELAGTIGRLK